jgi:hypothetical protein
MHLKLHGPGGMTRRSNGPLIARSRSEPVLARGPQGPKDPKLRRKIHTAIRTAIKLAEDRGVQAIPIREARGFLEGLFDDAFERVDVIAAYDHLCDLIVFNPDHTAWADMKRFLRQYPGLYSTDTKLHIVRHELGHAAHYRLLDDTGHRTIWDADLSSLERVVAKKVSHRAAWNVKEFVAEVYAGLWAGIEYDEEILRLHDQFRGPYP